MFGRPIRLSRGPIHSGIGAHGDNRWPGVPVATGKALPFEVRIPNTTTVKAMRAADRGKGKRHRSADDLLEEVGIRSLRIPIGGASSAAIICSLDGDDL